MAAVGRRTGQRRKIVFIVVYIPPHYNAEQNRALYRYTNDAVLKIKSKYDDPYIVYGGDFNRRNFRASIVDYPEIKEIHTQATRGSAVLDILGSNMNDSLIDSGVTEAIVTEEGVETDHLTVFATFRMQRVPSYSIEEYSYRHLTEEGHLKFGEWIDRYDWSKIMDEQDVDEIVKRLHLAYEEGLNDCYEYKTGRKKSSEPA